MDSVTQAVLGVLQENRERVTNGETVTLDKIPVVLADICRCPLKDQKCLTDHFAMTLAASDDHLDDIPVYQALLELYLTDGTTYATMKHS